MVMAHSKEASLAAVVLAQFAVWPAFAQQPEQAPRKASPRLEVTMTLLPENAGDAREITRKIELPAASPPAAGGKRPAELPGADHGKGEGLEKAAEARERGRDFGRDVAEQARENRESAGRSSTPPRPPVDGPALPQIPSSTKP